MRKTLVMLLALLVFVSVSNHDGYSYSSLLVESSDWEIVESSDYPEVRKNENSEEVTVSKWSPEPFNGRGELIKKWEKEIGYIDESQFNIQPTKNGWIYISPDQEISDDSFGYLGGENYTNILIDPETGESKTLTPKFLMQSRYYRTDKLVCSPPYTPKASGEPIDIRCYDLENDKVIWSIHDERVGRIWASPNVPLFHSNGRYFYIHSGITEFDINTGEILWSSNLIESDTEKSFDGYVFPGIAHVHVLDDFVLITTGSRNYYWYYKIDMKNKTIDKVVRSINHEQRYILDEKELWMTSEDDKFILKYNLDSMMVEKKYGIKLSLKSRIDKSYSDTETYYSIDAPIGRFTPIRVFIASEKQILKCDSCPGEYFVSNTFSRGYQSILPCYKYKTYDFLFDKDNPYELIEVLPEIASNKETYIQYFDNQIIVHTRDSITSYDFKTNEELWSIDKSKFSSPEKAKVLASDSHGILVQDYSNNKKALFYCYDAIIEIPEPEPEPEPEPTPEPEPDPDPSPIPEPVVPDPIKIEFQIDRESYIIDGSERVIDAAPVIQNGRTLLPARFVTEPLGGDVGWEATDKKVVCTLGETTVEMWIGKPIAKVNDEEVQIDPDNPDVVPTIINDRTMVPMRFLAETFGCEVEWVAEIKEIILTYEP